MLAAGSGARMGQPKATLVLAGERLIDRAVRALRDGGCAPILAVIRDGVVVAGASAVVNPDPERGMRSSLELAVDAAGECDALAVLLVDMPGVDATAVRAAVSAWRPGRIVVASYGGRRGHPTVMSPTFWRTAAGSGGPDEGARRFVREHRDLLDEVEVPGDATDLDTPADVARWTNRVE